MGNSAARFQARLARFKAGFFIGFFIFFESLGQTLATTFPEPLSIFKKAGFQREQNGSHPPLIVDETSQTSPHLVYDGPNGSNFLKIPSPVSSRF